MILRGAVLSEKRLALDALGAELAAAVAPRTPGASSKLPEAHALARASNGATREAYGATPEASASARESRGATPEASASTREPLGAAPSDPASLGVTTPPPITLDAVKTWLVDASPDARADLAITLAEDIDALRSAAQAEGFESGRAEALAQTAERSRNAIAALEAVAREAEAAFNDEITQLTAQCVDIVCAAFAKIAGPTLETREAALGAVLEVLKRVRDERALAIRVSPADIQALRECETAIAHACAGREYSLVADPRVDAGGCIVESTLGGLDGRFDVQLRGVVETLRAAKSATAGVS